MPTVLSKINLKNCSIQKILLRILKLYTIERERERNESEIIFWLINLFRSRPTFFSLIDSEKYSWDVDEHRELLRNMLMTASDIAASCKPWSIQYRVAKLVTDEFLTQGDKERNELKIQPQALMDRERQHELPMLQLHWIADICLPLYQVRFSFFFSLLLTIFY